MSLRVSPRPLAALCVLAACAAAAQAADCAVTVESNDAMQFSTKSIAVPRACKAFAITLKHVGRLPAAAMGHNLVVTTTADMAATAADGIAAGLPNGYLKPNDPRVIAATKMIGGGESATAEVPVSRLKPGTSHAFFCSFPGHASIMKGSLVLTD